MELNSLEHLQNSKNLLAFSAGGDSTALLFLLLQHNITFDIAIVNYGIREQSIKEVAYAKELANLYGFRCFVLDAMQIDSNFEAKAREIRYDFFEEVISTCSYNNLLTAHHLGDRFEWMLMQFCKGAGCVEMAGMRVVQEREYYRLIRPLLHVEKSELLLYLKDKKIKYFEDETNLNEDIKRNHFRHKHTQPLLSQYAKGIKKSFKYIDMDRESLIYESEIHTLDEFTYFRGSNMRSDIYSVDKFLKSQNYMLSASERELLTTHKTLIVGRKFLINFDRGYIFIVPYIDSIAIMSKEFKEQMRVLKIEPKLRYFVYKNHKVVELLNKLLN